MSKPVTCKHVQFRVPDTANGEVFTGCLWDSPDHTRWYCVKCTDESIRELQEQVAELTRKLRQLQDQFCYEENHGEKWPPEGER